MTTATLRIGPWTLAFQRLDAALTDALAQRSGPFFSPQGAGEPTLSIRVGEAAAGTVLPRWSPGETYRMEAMPGPGIPAVRSYGFVLAPRAPGVFALDLAPDAEEPVVRRVDNATRLLVARLALGAGGFAMHAAGVVDGGRAHVLAGPSRSGKTTAVTSLGWPSLGDDFAAVIPGGDGWSAPATPFNSEAVPATTPTGAGRWPRCGGLRRDRAARSGICRRRRRPPC